MASLTATLVDFGITVALVESTGLWPVWATAFGALAGAATNFSLGRYWSFKASHGRLRGQAFRYALVSGTSLFLNSFGVLILFEWMGAHYIMAKAITSFLVGVFFNFPLHRHVVFK